MPRPLTLTPDILQVILDRIANGETLKAICREDWAPDPGTFRRWVRHMPELRKAYEQAQLDRADALAEEMLDVACDTSKDTFYTEKGTPYCNHEWVQRSRLKVDTIKFLVSKLLPKRFGDRTPDVIAVRELDVEAEKKRQLGTSNVERITREFIEPEGEEERLRERVRELQTELDRLKHGPKAIACDAGLPRGD